MKWVLLDSSMEWVEVQFHPFLSSALDGGEWSAARILCCTYEERANLMYPKYNSYQVNSFPTPHSFPKVQFTVSIPHILTLIAILKLYNLGLKGKYKCMKFILWRRCMFTCIHSICSNQSVSNCSPSRYPLLHYYIHNATLTDTILKHTAPQRAFTGPCALQRKVAIILWVNQEIIQR